MVQLIYLRFIELFWYTLCYEIEAVIQCHRKGLFLQRQRTPKRHQKLRCHVKLTNNNFESVPTTQKHRQISPKSRFLSKKWFLFLFESLSRYGLGWLALPLAGPLSVQWSVNLQGHWSWRDQTRDVATTSRRFAFATRCRHPAQRLTYIYIYMSIENRFRL